ncbi:unnamed protein product [Brachionus calyciflorus]|uniref:Uncharacterized protein n=1 Tax=Brachionus calyciflorus TaxID=104777 RepID=A0A813MD38_9BILA|nr:unnamed protein product [Brachionus calyciflorus]
MYETLIILFLVVAYKINGCNSSVTLTREDKLLGFSEHKNEINHEKVDDQEITRIHIDTNCKIRAESESRIGVIHLEEQSKVAQTSNLSYEELSKAIGPFTKLNTHVFLALKKEAKLLKLKLDPKYVMTDFEVAAINSFKFVLLSFKNNPRIEKFLKYFVDTYYECSNFESEMWNHFETVNRPRTNNNLEGYSNKLSNHLSVAHPNIFKAIYNSKKK